MIPFINSRFQLCIHIILWVSGRSFAVSTRIIKIWVCTLIFGTQARSCVWWVTACAYRSLRIRIGINWAVTWDGLGTFNWVCTICTAWWIWVRCLWWWAWNICHTRFIWFISWVTGVTTLYIFFFLDELLLRQILFFKWLLQASKI